MSRRRSKKQTASKTIKKPTRRATPRAAFRAASKAALKTTSNVATKPACHFLRVPIGKRISILVFSPPPANIVFAEIRLKIYGYLTLNPPRASLDRDHYYDTLHHYCEGTKKTLRLEDEEFDGDSSCADQYAYLDSEDDMLDIGGFNPYGIAVGDMCDGMFNDLYCNGGAMGFGDDMFSYVNDQYGDDMDTSSSFSDLTGDEDERHNGGDHGTHLHGKKLLPKGGVEKGSRIRRHLAILSTNRQIYNEASALLYSDLTINVNPADAVTHIHGNTFAKQTAKVWRHDPSKGFGLTNTKGQTTYKSFSLDGSLEPHVFSRFETISYHATFSFDGDFRAPTFYINDDLSVRAEDAAKFSSYLTTAKGTTRWYEVPVPGRPLDNGPRETCEDVADVTLSSSTVADPSTAEILQKFVDLLSNSPLICNLEFVLNLQVHRRRQIKDFNMDFDDESDLEEDEKNDEKDLVANEKATELFLESRVLDPLRQLSNVKCFLLKVATEGRECEVMELQRKHLNIIGGLKEAIEMNWAVKHDPRQASAAKS